MAREPFDPTELIELFEEELGDLRSVTIPTINYLSELTVDEDSTYFLIRNFLARGIGCLESIYLLGREGRTHDCAILARSLVELVASSRYVYIEEKIEAYRCLVWRKKAKNLSIILQRKSISGRMSEQQKSRIKAQKKSFDSYLVKADKKDRVKWSTPKVKEMLTHRLCGDEKVSLRMFTICCTMALRLL